MSFQHEPTRLSVYKPIKQLMVSLTEVFVRSFSPYMDVETARDMAPHSYCSPGTTEGLVSGVLSKFKGRLLSEEDSTALERVLQILKENQESVRVYDVSRMADKLRALKRGIRKTPAVIINGEKYEGLEAISKALSTKQSHKTAK
ncbi:MAG: hypothetical protein ABSB28_10835 [Candidatus Bathyarchaeia archaeon]